ncbi:hypothetical protein [Propionivibrio sp.]|uniref:hypothetical protein n=1 Tax=Propionivibrio sp. TaxID=2212460 RepID=UPI003BF11D6F
MIEKKGGRLAWRIRALSFLSFEGDDRYAAIGGIDVQFVPIPGVFVAFHGALGAPAASGSFRAAQLNPE